MTNVIVIGGGISGLAAAHAIEQQAEKAGLKITTTVLEKEQRLGGKIWSIRDQGFLCEWGPNGFLDNKPMTLELCENIGIGERLLRSSDNARKRFIYSEGRLHRLPESGPAFLRSQLISWPGKFRLAGELFVPRRRSDDDESLADFARRRLGREALDKLIAPMVSGIFAGDPEQMSLQSCFPRICELEREFGGLLKAMIKLARKKRQERKEGKQVAGAAGPGGILTSFAGGIQELTDSLGGAVRGDIRLGIEVTAIRKLADGFRVELADGDSLEAEVVLSCAPAWALKTMAEPLGADIDELLEQIPYSPMNVVCFGYQREKIPLDLNGFGYLIPRNEGCHILGTLWDSSIFTHRAPEGMVLLRSMMGGATFTEAIELSENQVVAAVRADLERIMGIKAEPDFIRVFRHRRAIPMYLLEHRRRVAALEERLTELPGLFVSGNAFYGVGLNDCVHAGNQVADRIVQWLKSRSHG
ncbi:protoporphyrinogen oxidase [Geothermobacter ehrlichii]|uniref:Coproporphyrinogen III oxidase n=1 Tax=Geothermobacter ehrlichii TaxID=213224 RepID=A0A5D3WMZ9_9BACT|nr:protoporphyrinogen oxidase [Geothermobacter ehrlichii]TYO98970.1 protoporphyrinogen oxidase [Geothermobacter ehrlichii]